MIYKIEPKLYYYVDCHLPPKERRIKIPGPNPNMTCDPDYNFGNIEGDCSFIYGHCRRDLRGVVTFMTGKADNKWGLIDPTLNGNWSNIFGLITKLKHNISGLSGILSGLTFIDCTGWIGDGTNYVGHVLRILTDEEKEKGVSLEDYANGLLGPI